MSTIAVTAPPTTEPVTLAEARAHLRLDDDNTEEDSQIEGFISAARIWIENNINRKLITQTLTYRSWCLSGTIELTPNLQSIESVKYIDTDGVQQTLDSADYQFNKYALVGYVLPSYQKSWPDVRKNLNSIEIEFIAGYGTADKVPEDIKNALLLMVADSYENRGETFVGVSVNKLDTVNNLLSAYQVKQIT